MSRIRAVAGVEGEHVEIRSEEIRPRPQGLVAAMDVAEIMARGCAAQAFDHATSCPAAMGDARHIVDPTWASRPVPPRVVDPDVVFAGHVHRDGR